MDDPNPARDRRVLNPIQDLRELAREALGVQDACNLSGVVHAFSRVMKALGDAPECTGTDWKNRHPIAILFASKIASLTGCDDTQTFRHAYEAVAELAK